MMDCLMSKYNGNVLIQMEYKVFGLPETEFKMASYLTN